MKIAILSRNRHLYSTRRLVEEGVNRGHDVKVIDALHCSMNITSADPRIHYHEEVLENFDVVIPRIGASVTFYGTAVLRQFEMMGVFPLNESVAITRSRDKLRSLQLLARKGVGMPVTGFANKPDSVPELLNMVGGAPVVIKLLQGTQGIGVVLAETRKAAESVIEAFMGLEGRHSGAGIHQRSRWRRHSLLRDRRQGGARVRAAPATAKRRGGGARREGLTPVSRPPLGSGGRTGRSLQPSGLGVSRGRLRRRPRNFPGRHS